MGDARCSKLKMLTTLINPVMRKMRRYIICAIFIAVWMACGWCLPQGTDYYLFLGIPLVVTFQLGIARRPLRELWVRDGGGGAFRLDRTGVVLAVVLMLVPALNLMKNW